MFKKCHYYVRLLVSLCCICCVLFSNILYVNASTVTKITDIVNFNSPLYESGNVYTHYIYYPTNRTINENRGYFDWNITLSPNVNTNNINIDPFKTYCVLLTTNGSGLSATPYVTSGNSVAYNYLYASSLEFKTFEGISLSKLSGSSPYIFRGYSLVQGIDLLNGYSSSNNPTCNFSCRVCMKGDLVLNGGFNASNYASNYFDVQIPYNISILPLKDTYAYMNTTDMETKRQIQESERVIDNTLQEGNEIASDTNETTHSIFDSISDFFGSFFDNLIGIFVPEDGYFTGWFNRVNQLLTDKLGILYYPFSVIIDIFTRLSTALSDDQNNSCPIVIPELGITIQGTRYVFLQRQTIDLIDYNIRLENADTSNSSMFGLTSLIWVIRRFTSIVLIIAFMNMCVNKVKLILRGSEEA